MRALLVIPALLVAGCITELRGEPQQMAPNVAFETSDVDDAVRVTGVGEGGDWSRVQLIPDNAGSMRHNGGSWLPLPAGQATDVKGTPSPIQVGDELAFCSDGARGLRQIEIRDRPTQAVMWVASFATVLRCA